MDECMAAERMVRGDSRVKEIVNTRLVLHVDMFDLSLSTVRRLFAVLRLKTHSACVALDDVCVVSSAVASGIRVRLTTGYVSI